MALLNKVRPQPPLQWRCVCLFISDCGAVESCYRPEKSAMARTQRQIFPANE